MRSGPQVLALVGSRQGLIFMVRMIVLSGACDGVRGGSVTLTCMSGPSPQRQQLSGAQITVPAGSTAASAGVLPVQVTAGDGRRVHLLARGHMFNLAGPRPLGNSIESMDLGFALQARCLEAVARRSVDATSCVVPVPGAIDAAIARAYLDRKYPG